MVTLIEHSGAKTQRSESSLTGRDTCRRKELPYHPRWFKGVLQVARDRNNHIGL